MLWGEKTVPKQTLGEKNCTEVGKSIAPAKNWGKILHRGVGEKYCTGAKIYTLGILTLTDTQLERWILKNDVSNFFLDTI